MGAAKAAYTVARLELDFTQVTAPIAGRIGRRLLDPGNLVKADETVLATIIVPNPMYVYFDIDERTALRLLLDGKLKTKEAVAAKFALAGDKGYPRSGTVNYSNTELDPAKGTLRLRVVMPNADGLLMPGLSVRIRLNTSKSYKVLVVPRQAVAFDGTTAKAFVWIVTPKNLIEKRSVQGSANDNLWVVREGLQEDDQVVLNPDLMRSGMTVVPQRIVPPPLL